MIATIALLGALTFAAPEAPSEAKQWHDCMMSYKNSRRILFDVVYNEADAENHILFRNGKSFSSEAVHVYHKGQFWVAPLEISEDFYKEKKLIAVFGNEKFCYQRNFNWLRADGMRLTKYDAKKCDAKDTLEFKPESPETVPNAADVLVKKLLKEVEKADWCLNSKDTICDAEAKTKEMQRLSGWKTSACEKIANDKLKEVLSLRSAAMTNFTANSMHQALESAPAAQPARETNQSGAGSNK